MFVYISVQSDTGVLNSLEELCITWMAVTPLKFILQSSFSLIKLLNRKM